MTIGKLRASVDIPLMNIKDLPLYYDFLTYGEVAEEPGWPVVAQVVWLAVVFCPRGHNTGFLVRDKMFQAVKRIGTEDGWWEVKSVIKSGTTDRFQETGERMITVIFQILKAPIDRRPGAPREVVFEADETICTFQRGI